MNTLRQKMIGAARQRLDLARAAIRLTTRPRRHPRVQRGVDDPRRRRRASKYLSRSSAGRRAERSLAGSGRRCALRERRRARVAGVDLDRRAIEPARLRRAPSRASAALRRSRTARSRCGSAPRAACADQLRHDDVDDGAQLIDLAPEVRLLAPTARPSPGPTRRRRSRRTSAGSSSPGTTRTRARPPAAPADRRAMSQPPVVEHRPVLVESDRAAAAAALQAECVDWNPWVPVGVQARAPPSASWGVAGQAPRRPRAAPPGRDRRPPWLRAARHPLVPTRSSAVTAASRTVGSASSSAARTRSDASGCCMRVSASTVARRTSGERA